MKLNDLVRQFSIITGHYGSGKTNFAVNLAVALSSLGEPVTVVDLDLVNPYFRSADFIELFQRQKIRIIAPNFANSNLDIPSIPAEIDAVFSQNNGYIIFDVGGDDAGAAALGRFSARLSQTDHEVYYLYNACRFLTQTPQEAAQIMQQIEQASRMRVTQIINNTNLGMQTTGQMLRDSQQKANRLSHLTGIPVAWTTKENTLSCELDGPVFPIQRYVKSLWD